MARRVPDGELTSRGGIRFDLDLVALGDRCAVVHQVRDQERPPLCAGAHGDVLSEVQLPAVGGGDDRVTDLDLLLAHAKEAGVGGLVGPCRVDRMEARRFGDDGDESVLRGADLQDSSALAECAGGVGDARVALGKRHS